MTLKTLTAAALISAATAPAAFADATAFEGFYGGFSMGVTAPDINAIPTDIDTGLSGDVFVGYNFAVSPNWVLGGELSYGMSGGHQVTDEEDLERGLGRRRALSSIPRWLVPALS